MDLWIISINSTLPDPELANGGEPEEVVDELYCLVCEKAFKTMGARDSHLNSKKHKEALAELKRTLNVGAFRDVGSYRACSIGQFGCH